MLVTEFTRSAHTYRRFVREHLAKGWEELGEGGGAVWEIIRGYRYDHQIVDVKITPGGKSVFVKIEKRQPTT